MNPTLVIVLILAVTGLIAAITFALYKAGFRWKEFTVKAGLFEGKASRTPEAPSPAAPGGPAIKQNAADGGEIIRSGVTAPAASTAQIKQTAQRDGAKIEDSPIKLT